MSDIGDDFLKEKIERCKDIKELRKVALSLLSEIVKSKKEGIDGFIKSFNKES